MQDELLLAEAIREYQALVWQQLQWWASVSFGLMALSSFGRRHLSLLVTVALTFLYGLFTAFAGNTALWAMAAASSASYDMQELVSTEVFDSFQSRFLAEGSSAFSASPILAIYCFIATFLGVLVYLWYGYFKNRRDSK